MRYPAGIIVTALLLVIGASCASSGRDREPVVVLAASSLTDVFAEVATAFEAAHPDVDVQVSLAGSSALREQILQGAPADVFATANEATMSAVADAGELRNTAQVFATNELQIAVTAGNPHDVTGLESFERTDLLVGLCAVGVPCGDFADQALEQAGVDASIDTREPNVRALLTKISLGELDAGVVYRTDVLSGSGVQGIPLESDLSAGIVYPIAVLANAPNPAGAADFVDFVLSAEGRALLDAHGFGRP